VMKTPIQNLSGRVYGGQEIWCDKHTTETKIS
jgi:hypothetical protein